VLFSDGTVSAALQDRLAEYGCTTDACCKLAVALEAAAGRGVVPVVLVHVDQCGVLHAPHAQGRAYFHESDRDNVIVPVHDATGGVQLFTVAQLTPESPVLDDDWVTRSSS
jgi:hypothetical protein